jgi:hypothetical protein
MLKREMYLPIAATIQPRIVAAIADVVRELSPEVQRISYEVAQDWTGEWAVFFKVLLSDEAADESHLRAIVRKVVSRMSDRLDLPSLDVPGLGVIPYFDFRSQAEQTELNEPAWA